MKIDQLLAKVMQGKKQIEFLEHIYTSTEQYKDKDYDEVKPEVLKVLRKFIDSEIAKVESLFSVTDKPQNIPAQKTKVVNTEFDENEPEIDKSKLSKPVKPIQKNTGMLDFAMRYRALSGKQITFSGGQEGIVLGMDYPYLVVQTSDGNRHKLDPSNIEKSDIKI